MTTTLTPVVVGIDDLAASPDGVAAAIELGAWEAARHQVGLHLVCGHRMLPDWSRTGAALAADEASRTATGEVLDQTVAATRAAYPDLSVTGAVIPGSAANALVTASQTAIVVVVPADARAHYGGLTGGLVSVQITAHAHAPVIVVSQPHPAPIPNGSPSSAPRRVVVGVDASPSSAEAIGFAFGEASARGATLHAVHVWDLPTRYGLRPIVDGHADIAALQAAADRMLTDATRCGEDKFPDVPVVRDAVRSPNPVRVLGDAASGAELVVVGRRGHGGFASLLLGSVSDGVVRYASTNVAVVHDTPTPGAR